MRSQWIRSRIPAIFAALTIAAMFCFAMKIGRRPRFTGDDVQNLYGAWAAPLQNLLTSNLWFWPQLVRPFGGAFYRAMYAVTGFHPNPLYWFIWLVLAANLVLAWRIHRRLGATTESSLVALLILAAHPKLIDLSYNGGMLYDVFCFTLMGSVFLVYLRARDHGGVPDAGSLPAMAALTIAALNTKEMAVALPAALLAWEIVFRPFPPRDAGRWLLREGRGLLIVGAISTVFLVLHLAVKGPLTGLAAYTPVLSWSRFAETTNQYAALALFREQPLAGWMTASICAAVLAAAALTRSRVMLFALAWFGLTLLPMSFVTPRGGYVLYIPLMVGSLVASAWAGNVKLRRGVLFAGATVAMLVVHRAVWRAPFDTTPESRMAPQMRALMPEVKRPARILFVDDEFPEDSYELFFTMQLLYGNRELEVTRRRDPTRMPPLDRLPHYDRIFGYESDHYVELDNADSRRAVELRLRKGQRLGERVAMSDPAASPYIVKDVLGGTGEWRWTNAEPEFRFQAEPSRTPMLFARFVIAGVTLKQNGPKTLVFLVNGHELARERYSEEGEKLFGKRVPAEWFQGELTDVKIRVENPYIAEADHVKLGFLLKEVGFRPE